MEGRKKGGPEVNKAGRKISIEKGTKEGKNKGKKKGSKEGNKE
jgi:flagellar biosynthesis/type III secretory pathway protein FliH